MATEEEIERQKREALNQLTEAWGGLTPEAQEAIVSQVKTEEFTQFTQILSGLVAVNKLVNQPTKNDQDDTHKKELEACFQSFPVEKLRESSRMIANKTREQGRVIRRAENKAKIKPLKAMLKNNPTKTVQIYALYEALSQLQNEIAGEKMKEVGITNETVGEKRKNVRDIWDNCSDLEEDTGLKELYLEGNVHKLLDKLSPYLHKQSDDPDKSKFQRVKVLDGIPSEVREADISRIEKEVISRIEKAVNEKKESYQQKDHQLRNTRILLSLALKSLDSSNKKSAEKGFFNKFFSNKTILSEEQKGIISSVIKAAEKDWRKPQEERDKDSSEQAQQFVQHEQRVRASATTGQEQETVSPSDIKVASENFQPKETLAVSPPPTRASQQSVLGNDNKKRGPG